MKKRLFIALILCLITVLSLASFTACNKNDSNYNVPENLKQTFSLMENMLAYSLETKTPFGIACSDSPLQNEFSILSLSIFGNDATPECRVELYIMKSEAKATEFLSKNIGNEDYKRFADKNIVVYESKETPGLYETIKTKHFADDQQPEQFKLAIESINKVKNYYMFSVQFLTSFWNIKDGEILKNNAQNGIFEMSFSATPLVGNCFISSSIQQKEFPDDLDWSWEQRKAETEKHEEYTDDSFLEFITIGNNEYVKAYTKAKPRMVFKEYLEGYELAEWYCDTNTPTIPATHNGKPLLKIPLIAYDYKGITDIHFEGTKAQWEAINNASYYTLYYGVTIHCTDGDIAPTEYN